MSEGKSSVRGKRDWWFGFLATLPIFVQVQGSIGLYAEPWQSPLGLGVPIGFLAAALLLLPDLPAMTKRLPLGAVAQLAIGILCIWVSALAMTSAGQDPISLLHALQWIAPVCLISYVAVVVQEERRLSQLLHGLCLGTALALLYMLVLFALELFSNEGFESRLTQNRYASGMYQLYNYVPVGLTLAGLFSAGLCAVLPGRWNRWGTWWFLGATACIPLLTGARDPALIFILAAPFPAWWAARGSGLILLTVVGLGLVFTFLHQADGNLLVVQKLAALFNADASLSLESVLGNRMEIMQDYWGLVERHPYLGTRLLPPWIIDPESGVTAKSAHNFYLDTLAWAGPVALLALLALVLATLWSVPALLWGAISATAPPLLTSAARAAAAPAVGLLLISSNLRTPLREPISAMIGYLLVGFILCWAHRRWRV